MTFHDFLRARRSVREFLPDPIPDSTVERILTTATCGPSAHNRQPWRFVVVKEAQARHDLAQALITKMQSDLRSEGAPTKEIEQRTARSSRRIHEAPLLILLCRDVADVQVDTPEERTMNIQSTAAAGVQLLLGAQAENLGASWICWPLYAVEATRSALNLPNSWEPQAMFIIGTPKSIPAARDRKPLDSIVLRR